MPSDIGTTFRWIRFTFPGNIALTSGTKYWIVLRGGYDKSNTVYISWKCDDSAATFSGGNIAYYVNGATNAWTAVPNSDFMFRVLEELAGSNYYINGSNIELESGQLSAEYYSNIKDIGYLCEAEIIIQQTITVNENMTFSTDATRRFNDSPTLRFTGEELPGAVTFEIRTSEDNINWTTFEDWVSADYLCRYYQIKATITKESLSTSLVLSALTIKADLPDVDETGSDSITVAVDGKAVTFIETYHEAPIVNINIISGTGYVHLFSVIPDTTGFTVKLYQLDGTAVTGNFSWASHGI